MLDGGKCYCSYQVYGIRLIHLLIIDHYHEVKEAVIQIKVDANKQKAGNLNIIEYVLITTL